ncbi:hypothetical protein F4804DRAFT_303431, partial [Jackrogersella minutella]
MLMYAEYADGDSECPDECSDDEDRSEDDDSDEPVSGSKRKAKRSKGRPPKEVKSQQAKLPKFFFRWRGAHHMN